MVFPVVMYGCESWTVKKAEGQRIDAFELWCWRKLLRVPWTARRSNQSILKEIIPGISSPVWACPGGIWHLPDLGVGVVVGELGKELQDSPLGMPYPGESPEEVDQQQGNGRCFQKPEGRLCAY